MRRKEERDSRSCGILLLALNILSILILLILAYFLVFDRAQITVKYKPNILTPYAVLNISGTATTTSTTSSGIAPQSNYYLYPSDFIDYAEERTLFSSSSSSSSSSDDNDEDECDTSGSLISIKSMYEPSSAQFPNDYPICSFRHVCASEEGLSFFFKNKSTELLVQKMIDSCIHNVPYDSTGKRPPMCACFHKTFKPSIIPSEKHSLIRSPLIRGHYWSINKWVFSHHIAHWAQKLVLMQSIFQHYHVLYEDIHLPPIHGLLFHDTDVPLTDHERHILSISIDAAFGEYQQHQYKDKSITHPIWMNIFGKSKNVTDLDKSEFIYFYSKLQTSKSPSTSSSSTTSFTGDFSTCFERVSMTPAYGILSVSPYDTRLFTRVAYAHYGISHHTQFSNRDVLDRLNQYYSSDIHKRRNKHESLHNNTFRMRLLSSLLSSSSPSVNQVVDVMSPSFHTICPPRRVVLLYRSDSRRILNINDIETHLKNDYNIVLEKVTIDESTSSYDQASLFATSGLVLSSHSSQLINIMFSHPNAALIEITPEFYNADFGEYAHGMGVFFQYAIGGEVANAATPIDLNIQHCTEMLSICDGDSRCILSARYRCRQRHFKNKRNDFYANVTAVKRAISHSISHLNWKCGGLWTQYNYY